MNELSFEVDGRSYPLVEPGNMTMGEARELKRLSGGMTLAGAENALHEVDPDAWTAVLLISMRRVDPAAKDSVLDDVKPAELIGAMHKALEAAKAAADAAPPTPASNGAGVVEPSSLAMTPGVSGT